LSKQDESEGRRIGKRGIGGTKDLEGEDRYTQTTLKKITGHISEKLRSQCNSAQKINREASDDRSYHSQCLREGDKDVENWLLDQIGKWMLGTKGWPGTLEKGVKVCRHTGEDRHTTTPKWEGRC